MMLRGGPYDLSLADLEAAPHGIDLGPLEPRLPEILRTPSGKVELAPEPIVADVDRLHGALSANGNGGMVLIGRRAPALEQLVDERARPARRRPRPLHGAALHDRRRAPRRRHRRHGPVTSRTGSLDIAAEVTDDLMPGVVSIPHGWARANSNVLADEDLLEPLTGTAVLNGIPVTVAAHQATRWKRAASSSRAARSFFFVCPWIWQTRLSDTPSTSPISASVRFLT